MINYISKDTPTKVARYPKKGNSNRNIQKPNSDLNNMTALISLNKNFNFFFNT
jgi:hypothetical protein